MTRTRLQTMIDQWRSLREVRALSPDDLSDLGMTGEQIERLVRMPAVVPERLTRMAGVFGLTTAEVQADRQPFLAMLEVCDGCASQETCRSALAFAETLQPEDVGFCPNAASYREMQATRAD